MLAGFPFLGLTKHSMRRKTPRPILVLRLLTIMVQIANHFGEVFLGLLVKVGDSDTRSEDSIVRMFTCAVRGGLSSEVLRIIATLARCRCEK